jgi:phage replication-related protein YjqB (UPF0714/DUF867 family)
LADLQITVRRAARDSELTEHPEHCWVDGRLLRQLGLRGRPQVRVRRGDELALYTVSATVDEARADLVRMGQTGRHRLDGPNAFDALADPAVTRSDLCDHEAAERGEFVERIDDDGRQHELIALAPHGGAIEHHTDAQAELVAATIGCSSWRCKGWRPGGGAHERWHITSTDIDPGSFPLLATIARRRFRHAVAFHGFTGSGVVIGGRASKARKQAMRDAIGEALRGTGIEVRVATAGDPLGGNAGSNIVNRLTIRRFGGIQIEQSDDARERHWCTIAEAVSGLYAELLGTRPVDGRPCTTK